MATVNAEEKKAFADAWKLFEDTRNMPNTEDAWGWFMNTMNTHYNEQEHSLTQKLAYDLMESVLKYRERRFEILERMKEKKDVKCTV